MKTLDDLRFDRRFMANVMAWEQLPARPARYAPMPATLRPELSAALTARGLSQLYSHQTQAIEAIQRAENVVVVTGTASGKTLCYNLPVLNTLLAEPTACALYLFPTKALAQDQADELTELVQALSNQKSQNENPQSYTKRHEESIAKRSAGLPQSPVSSLQSQQLPLTNYNLVHIYDGDTPTAQRSKIRKASGVLISNPDMLHTGILPHHTRWAEWLGNLRYVVLDELHTYRGVFGSHVANILRRLKRLCAFYGAHPQFIGASATIANPRELAETLIEAPVTVVDDDGSPRAEKSIIIYNPPLLDPEQGLRRSYLLEAQTIAARFLADEVPTVMFARTRNATEVLLGYWRDEMQKRELDPTLVRGYRGGYLPEERRAIERGLREGVVRGVVATNALELGVDIGALGAAVLAGYPGTLASFWQQAGRAGRRSEQSVAILVASAAPLDQYLALHPRYLFEQSPEHAFINPNNLAVLASHLRCAVFELPFTDGEAFGTFTQINEVLEALSEEGELHATAGAYRWVGSAYPAEQVSLRTAGDDRIVIQDVSGPRPRAIGDVERATASVRVHAGAVYLHEGRSYTITRLDWEAALADAMPQTVDYFTEAQEAVEVQFLAERESNTRFQTPDPESQTRILNSHLPASSLQSPLFHLAWGDLLITSQAVSYRKVRRYTHENLGHTDLTLPAREFQTTGCWLWFPPEAVRALEKFGVAIGPNDYGPNWQAQRLAARQRDHFRCRSCGRAEGGQEHDIHHIKPFRSFGYLPGLNANYLAANVLDNLLTLCRACHTRLETHRGTQTALGGLAYVLGNVTPLFLMCDPRDLSVWSELHNTSTTAPTITLYDRAPDGLGLAEMMYRQFDALLHSAHELVHTCPCTDGCPACVGPITPEAAHTKDLTRTLLEALTHIPA